MKLYVGREVVENKYGMIQCFIEKTDPTDQSMDDEEEE